MMVTQSINLFKSYCLLNGLYDDPRVFDLINLTNINQTYVTCLPIFQNFGNNNEIDLCLNVLKKFFL